MKTVYMDHAAATPVDPAVVTTMLPYLTEKFYNPSAMYGAAQIVAADLKAARSKVAHCLGVRPIEIVFTAGGTEANNMAISGVMQAYPGSKIIISSIEHDSIREVARKYDCFEVAVNEQGILDLASLERAIDDTTVLISIMYANNEIGVIQPIREVSKLIHKIRATRRASGNQLPLYIHTDAAQAANYLDLHVARLGVDLMSINGGKIYGPKQSGALYIKSGITLKPLIVGGGQEHNLRSGTENVAGIVGFATALDVTVKNRERETLRLRSLQKLFVERLKQAIPEVVINGSIKKRLPNNVHITIPGTDNERLLFALDERGIMAAAGSACSASHEESSHVLHALGLSDETARSSLRFTMGRSTTPEDIQTVVDAVAELLAP